MGGGGATRTPAPCADHFTILDTQDTQFYPIAQDPYPNDFVYEPIDLHRASDPVARHSGGGQHYPSRVDPVQGQDATRSPPPAAPRSTADRRPNFAVIDIDF